MTGRHSTRTHVCDKIAVYDTGTKKMMYYNTQMVRKGKLQPVASMALGAVVALGITIMLFGNVVPTPAEPAPTIVTSTAAMIQAPEALPDPPALVPSFPKQRLQRHRITVSRPLPTRVYPIVKQPVMDLPKEGKQQHHHDKAQKSD